MMTRLKQGARGVTFIEVLVASAVILLFFAGIIAGFRLAITIIGHSRAESGALALANEQVEYLRSLTYDEAGTVGGIPAGLVPQNETLTLNTVSYNRRTLIQYVDASEDGEGGDDQNGITADYKRAKVELTWAIRGEAKSLSLVTNLIPRGIETVAGGGTLTINVFDADALPVAAAEVRVVNTTTSPAIDVTVYTNAAGIAMFPGAPASGGYEVTATKIGYSTDQTYSASVANPNPNPPHISVIEGEVSTVNFAIDRTSALAIRMVEPPSEETDEDTFTDQSALASVVDTVTDGGSLTLATTSSGYVASGGARSVAIAPASLFAWEEASWSASVPVVTTLAVHMYAIDELGGATLVPDADLPGNAAGFGTSPINIAALDAALYPRLAIGFDLTSADPLQTPAVMSRALSYVVADAPIPNISFTLAGAKNIGTDGSGVPIKKYEEVLQTNGSGLVSLEDLEWDLYSMDISGGEGYDIADACPEVPYTLEPNTTATSTLVLVPSTAHSLLIRIESADGAAIEGASVHLTRTGIDETLATSACGYAHFPGLTTASDYTLEVSAPGYAAHSESDVIISGTAAQTVVLAAS